MGFFMKKVRDIIEKKVRDIIELPEVRRKVLYAIGLCFFSTMMGILLAGFFYALEYGW